MQQLQLVTFTTNLASVHKCVFLWIPGSGLLNHRQQIKIEFEYLSVDSEIFVRQVADSTVLSTQIRLESVQFPLCYSFRESNDLTPSLVLH